MTRIPISYRTPWQNTYQPTVEYELSSKKTLFQDQLFQDQLIAQSGQNSAQSG